MIYTVTLNPAIDKTVEIPDFQTDTVNRITTLRKDPGGKGINVSKVIAKLGGTSRVFAILGQDNADEIQNMLRGDQLECCFTLVPGVTRTNLKVIDPVRHTNTDINEPGVTVTTADLKRMTERLIGMIKEGDIVILSGSLPKGAPEDTYSTLVAACKNAGAKVFLDADGPLLADGLKAAPYLIKPNNDELSRLMGKTLETPEELAATARTFLEQGIEKVIVSMGGRGALYVTKDRTIYAQGLKVPVGSTVGAGDSVVAALAYAENNDMSLEETVRLSTATGAANVMQSGTQAAEYSVIEKLIERVVFYDL
ncbi:MAG: 1-phosphofructokinase [Lachnospiraceae bacterium]|nr:1-phosphofructokinase [Lachnospiraceae bacterium]